MCGKLDYTMSFLSSLNYTENCYYCRYATDKRVGDITIGDAWGSDLKEEIDNGISLIMCQTEKGEELLEAGICLFFGKRYNDNGF